MHAALPANRIELAPAGAAFVARVRSLPVVSVLIATSLASGCRSGPVGPSDALRAEVYRPFSDAAFASERAAERSGEDEAKAERERSSAPSNANAGIASTGSPQLDRVLARIAAANPTIAAAAESVAEARAARRVADAMIWPELSFSFGVVSTDEPAQAFGLLLDQHELSLGPGFDPTPERIENWRKEARLDWALFAPGRGAGRRAAEAGEEAAALAGRAIERRLLNAGVQAWLGWSAARALEEVALESVGVVEQRLDQTRLRQAEGAALRADVLRLETRLAAARQEAERARLGVRLALSSLNALMGAAPDAALEKSDVSAVLEEPIDFAALTLGEGLPDDLETLLERAEAHRLDLAAAVESARAAGFQRRASEDQRKPSLGLFAAYDIDGSDPGLDSDLDSSTLGIGLRWPLSRRTAASIERAAAGERREFQELRARASEVAREVHDTWASVGVARETLALAESSVGTAEEAYRILAAAQDVGAATVTDVLEAEDARRRARVGVVAARAGLALARARLVGALGGAVGAPESAREPVNP